MKIVIEIDEKSYKAITTGSIDYYDALNGLKAIAIGTPLPEHHGRLIDEEDMLSVIMFSKLFDNAKVGEVKEVLLKIPTIVEGSESE